VVASLENVAEGLSLADILRWFGVQAAPLQHSIPHLLAAQAVGHPPCQNRCEDAQPPQCSATLRPPAQGVSDAEPKAGGP
jgi:hypothetical protein